MTAIRQEVLNYIDEIPDAQLEALRPILRLLTSADHIIIETDLTDDEKATIAAGREEYKANPKSFVPLKVI